MGSFLELCQHRRSIRKYKHQTVEQEKIDYMLRCALMAPSGKRLNPWEFVVVTDEAVIRAMAPCKEYGAGMLETAMVAIVVAVDEAKSSTALFDGAIAAEHLLLAAEDQGLGACWCHINGREEAESLVKKLTGVPEGLTVICVVTVGYKDEERRLYDLDKLPFEKVHKGRF